MTLRPLHRPTVLGLVRHAMTLLGGALIATGHADPAAVEAITGGLIALIGIAWSMLEK